MGFFDFLTEEIAIDLGTANTLVIHNDKVVVDSPSIVARDRITGKIIAAGKEAAMMQGKTHENIKTIRPLKDGVIADFDASEQMLTRFIKEIPALKKKIFTELDKVCKPETILASNTSSISINAIAAATSRPDRVIGMHFMNPVPVMKLVEIINGSDTSDDVTAAVVAASERMGKTALACNDSPGFISNRILCPMINEAILTLEEGVAEPAAIDGIMKLGMNHPIGPLALADLIGLDTVLHIMNVLHEGFEGDPKYAPSQLLRDMVAEGKLGRKSGSGFFDYP